MQVRKDLLSAGKTFGTGNARSMHLVLGGRMGVSGRIDAPWQGLQAMLQPDNYVKIAGDVYRVQA